MKAVNFILVFLYTINNSLLSAQEIPLYCNEKIDYIANTNLEFGNIDSIETAYQYNLLRLKKVNRSSSTFILPVIIHVLNESSDPLVDIVQAQNIIDNLNDAFANRGEYYLNNGNDTNIEFCLATRDPDGNITSGIENIISESTNLITQKAYDEMIAKYHWPTTQYINIYYVNRIKKSSNLGYAVGGFATYPNAHGFAHDGIVVLKYDYEHIPTNNAIVKHEMAHYLGLIHTFENGCKNDNCLIDGDKVCDTPPENIGAKLPCGAYSSCDSDDDDTSTNNPFRPITFGGLGNQNDVNTYMDYKVCKKIFTNGQIDRMHFFINGLRKSLLQSKACSIPCSQGVEALFDINKTSFISGDSVKITNNSKNADKYIWKLNDKIFTIDTVPDLSILKQGNYNLKLISSSNDTLCNADSLEINFEIICPVIAKMEFILNDSILAFKNQSVNQTNFEFKLYNGSTIVFYSTKNSDTFNILPNSYQLCITARNEHCNDSVCHSIVRLPFGSEVCDNTVDDDLDGYVDYFDKDCICIDTIYNAGCISDCNYVPDSFPSINLNLKWKSHILNVNNGPFKTISPNFAVSDNHIFSPYSFKLKDSVENGIIILNLYDGSLIKKIVVDTSLYSFGSGHVSIFASLDNNIISFVHNTYNGGLIFNNSNQTSKIYSKGSINLNHTFFPKFADFNHDNIAEVYSGNSIFNPNNGELLIQGVLSAGCNSWTSSLLTYSHCNAGAHSVVADLTDSPGLELACGNIVYELQLNNLISSIGNILNPILAPPIVLDGFTAIADIDLDGKLDVIVVNNKSEGGAVWVWNPRTSNLIASGESWYSGGIPAIGDVNGDCHPEIIIAFKEKLNIYQYDGSVNLKIINSLPIKENTSGFTGLTLFDFNSDGKNEIIYRDENYLRIYEGSSGLVLDSFEIHSGTAAEYPIISDIDDDGQAEILVNGYLPSEPDSLRIFCFESAGHPWAPSRKVWNQTGYHITNVNDDLTIPIQQQNNAAFFDTDSCAQSTCNQPYNTFMCQATYRDQNGCVRWPAMDMVTDIIDYVCDGDSVTFRIEIRNQSTNTFRHDSMSIGFYSNSDNVPFYIIQRPWAKSQDADTIIYTIQSLGINKIRARVNILVTNSGFTENIKGLTPVLECDYENNTDSITIDLAIKTLELGPDITKCRTEAITLTAPNDFVSYQWSDFSQGNTYTTAETGIHTLITTDQCGRVYADSVELKIDVSLLPELGSEVTKCEDELITFSVGNVYEWVQWLPAEFVSCDTCHIINVNADTSFQLIMIGSNNGCIDADSVLVNITPLKKRNEEKFICRGDSTLFNGLYISDEGMYEYRTLGCDSLVTLNLLVIPPDSIMLPTQEICRGDSLLFLGTWYKIGTNATIKLRNQYQCDSFITFELRVIDTLKTNETLSICQGDSVRIFDEWQSGPGVFSKSYQSARGCDSLAQVQLIVNSVFVNSESQKICVGDSIYIFGQWKKASGLFTQKYQAINGCDSTENIELIVEPLLVKSDSILICEGDSVFVNGQSYSNEGNYQTILLSTEGCDTIYNFHLKYSPLLTKTENYTICEGDSVFINGSWLVPELVDGQAQVYVYEVREVNCKTEVTANFTINNSQITNNKFILCPEDSILLNSTWVNSTTELTYTLQSAEGCDSIIQAKVTKLRWPEPPMIELDCEDNVYNASIIADENWDVLWSDMTNASATVLKESPAWVKVSTDENCEKIFDINLESLPDLSQLPSFEDQNILEGNDINVKVDLAGSEWQVLWLPASAVSCDTCFETNIGVDANTTITLELKHINGCTYFRTFDVIVEKEIFTIIIPNIINPTSTSGNNIWTVDFPERYIVQEAKVYDRWGNVVYNIEGSNLISWDGKIDGCEVVPGVYVYFIRYLSPEGNLQVIKGDVTVVR